jgi:undecaprenyl-diphosphatase
MSAAPSETSRIGGRRFQLTHPRRAGVVGTALLLIAVGGAIALQHHPAPFGMDSAWAEAMTAGRGAWLTFIAKHVFDPLGRFPISWVIVAMAGAVLWRDGRRRAIAILVIGEAASWATNSVIKAVVDRPRPPGALIEASRSSFPSGHAAFAAVTAVLFVGLLVPSGRRAGPAVLAGALAVAMGWSRTYLLVHWVTDVIGGLCVGAGVGLITLATMGTAADRTG